MLSQIDAPQGLCQPVPMRRGRRPLRRQAMVDTRTEHIPVSVPPLVLMPTASIQLPQLQEEPFIMVVDDDQSIGMLLSDLLGDVGYCVEVLYDGDVAFEAACRRAPELILTDYMMPTSGETLALRLRANPSTANIPVAMMSSARPRIKDLEGIPFLPKPFDLDDVVAFVARFAAPQRYTHGIG